MTHNLNILDEVSNITNSSIKISIVLFCLFSFIIILILFFCELKERIIVQEKNIAMVSSLYENQIIVTFNNDSEVISKQMSFKIETNSDFYVIAFYNDNDIVNLKKDCINYGIFISIFNGNKICYLKKISYSKNQFYYIVKTEFIFKYSNYIFSILIFILLSFFSYFICIYIFGKNKKYRLLSYNLKIYQDCLKYLDNSEYNLLYEKLNYISLIELKKSILHIVDAHKMKSKALVDVENKAVIIHDITKLMNCIPMENNNENIKLFSNIISNIKNILKLSFDSHNQFDIRNCIIEASEILSINGAFLDVKKIKSYIFYGNEVLLTEVFFNIFSNIVDHSRVLDSKNIFIDTFLQSNENKLYYYSVIRNYGSYSMNVNHVFNKNYTEMSKNKKYGTGLHFCKKVIEIFGGSISCISEKKENLGESYFEVTLVLPAIFHSEKGNETEGAHLLNNLVITVLEDDPKITEMWKNKLGDNDVFYFDDPQDFLIEFRDNSDISRTNLIVSDYYFRNIPLEKLINFEMLKKVYKYNGKIFIHTNAIGCVNNKEYFDYVFNSKNEILSKNQLLSIFNNIH